MKFCPHEYQKFAIKFIEENPISAVFLDCGLGKTVISLTAINDLLFDKFEIQKVLIIAPLRVARDTWSTEIEKWEHLKNLTYSVAVGTAEERKKALQRQADIYIINRENVPWLIEESGIVFDFQMLVIDDDFVKRFPEYFRLNHAQIFLDKFVQNSSRIIVFE